MKPTILAVAVAASALTLGACGGSSGSAGASSPAAVVSAATTVMVVDDPATIGTYSPPSATVRAGETVRWIFKDDNPHTVTADGGSFGSKPLHGGKEFTHRFDSAGTYNYHCAIHPEMHGTIVVS